MDKFDILANFDIDNNLSDCTTDENVSDISLSDTSSENSNFEECHNNKTTGNEDVREVEKPAQEIKSENNETLDLIEGTESVASLKLIDKVPSKHNVTENEVIDEVPSKLDLCEEPDIKTPLVGVSPRDTPQKELSNFDEESSLHISDVESVDYQNDEFTHVEHSMSSDYNKYISTTEKVQETFTLQNSARSETSDSPKIRNTNEMSQDEKRFQNLQDEINLLNILMYEAENQTEKCGSLYNSFTNEINNSLTYGKSKHDDCTNSLASFVDGSKFDAISVKSELLFSDYGKSDSNYDVSEAQDKLKTSEKEDNESISSVIEKKSISSINSIKHKTCQSEVIDNGCNIPLEDRVLILWNQIIRLKCSLKSLQLNLKEKQMETLMKVNEFLLNQNQYPHHIVSRSPSASKLYDKNDRNLQSKLSESFVYTKNNKVKEDIALNNLKIALIECNMLSSTASSLVNSIPDYERSDIILDTKESILSKCCCDRLRRLAICSCHSQKLEDKKEIRIEKPVEDKSMIKARNFKAVEDERKVKSNEELSNKFPTTKYCLSDLHLQELSPRACI